MIFNAPDLLLLVTRKRHWPHFLIPFSPISYAAHFPSWRMSSSCIWGCCVDHGGSGRASHLSKLAVTRWPRRRRPSASHGRGGCFFLTPAASTPEPPMACPDGDARPCTFPCRSASSRASRHKRRRSSPSAPRPHLPRRRGTRTWSRTAPTSPAWPLAPASEHGRPSVATAASPSPSEQLLPRRMPASVVMRLAPMEVAVALPSSLAGRSRQSIWHMEPSEKAVGGSFPGGAVRTARKTLHGCGQSGRRSLSWR